MICRPKIIYGKVATGLWLRLTKFHYIQTNKYNIFSIFNINEVNVLLKYIKLLMKETINGKPVQETDIGIISPYKKQVIFAKSMFI